MKAGEFGSSGKRGAEVLLARSVLNQRLKERSVRRRSSEHVIDERWKIDERVGAVGPLTSDGVVVGSEVEEIAGAVSPGESCQFQNA